MRTGELIGHAIFLTFIAGIGALAGTSSAGRMRRNGAVWPWDNEGNPPRERPPLPGATRQSARYIVSPAELRRIEQRINDYMGAPVTRREFDQEIDRLWSYLDPSLRRGKGASRGAPDLSLRTPPQVVARTSFKKQVEQTMAKMSAGRPIPKYASEEAVRFAEEMLSLRMRRKELYAIPGVHDYSNRILRGQVPQAYDPALLSQANELLKIRGQYDKMRRQLEDREAVESRFSRSAVQLLPVNPLVKSCPVCGGTDYGGRGEAAVYCSKRCKREAEMQKRRQG